jgi:hypothetical protein
MRAFLRRSILEVKTLTPTLSRKRERGAGFNQKKPNAFGE